MNKIKQFLISVFMWFAIPVGIALVILVVVCLVFFGGNWNKTMDSFFHSNATIYESPK